MERFEKWLKYELQHTAIMQSKHADHHDETDNIERWAYFQGYQEALRRALELVKKYDV